MGFISESDKQKAKARAKNRKNGIPKNGTPKLTSEQRETIRTEYKTSNFTLRQLAAKYSVNHETIRKICDGIDKKSTSGHIQRVKDMVVEKVLSIPDVTLEDKNAIIHGLGLELTPLTLVNNASLVLLNRVIKEGGTCEPQHLKDFAATAKTAGQMLGVSTCSNAPQIVNTNAVQNVIETVYKYEVIE